MCGRFNATADPLARLLAALLGGDYAVVDRWNVAPTEQVPVLRRGTGGALEAPVLRWWLTPFWSKAVDTRYAMFNARSETLATSRAFAEPFRRRRAVVPASGFFEWARHGGRREPWYLRDAAGDGLLLAGVWDRWARGDEVVESFAIVTTAVHPGLAFVHDRQPVFLDRAGLDAWLDPAADPADLLALCRPRLPVAMRATPVSSLVNNARHKEPRIIEPIGADRIIAADPDGTTVH